MKLECPFSHRTTSKIYCKKLNSICVFQRWRPCRGWYDFTEAAQGCRARNESEVNDGIRTLGE